MARVQHVVCDDCWFGTHGPTQPERHPRRRVWPCCACGRLTSSGIIAEGWHDMLECGGEHHYRARLAAVQRGIPRGEYDFADVPPTNVLFDMYIYRARGGRVFH